jgi:hypothetical protein
VPGDPAGLVCEAIGAVVSGNAPATAQAPYTTTELYSAGGATNFTALVEEGLIKCKPTVVFNNSVVGPAGFPLERVQAAFTENCPDLLDDDYSVTPENNLVYECNATCIDWLINFEACRLSDLAEVRVRLCYIPPSFTNTRFQIW